MVLQGFLSVCDVVSVYIRLDRLVLIRIFKSVFTSFQKIQNTNLRIITGLRLKYFRILMSPVPEYNDRRISWLNSIQNQLNHFHYFPIPWKSSEIFVSISCLFFQSDPLNFQLPASTFLCIYPPLFVLHIL